MNGLAAATEQFAIKSQNRLHRNKSSCLLFPRVARKDLVLQIYSDISSSVISRQLEQVQTLQVCAEASSAADTTERQNITQKKKLQNWAQVNFLRYNKATCKVQHLGGSNPQYQQRFRGEWIESSPATKDLGVLVDEQLEVSWQHTALKVNQTASKALWPADQGWWFYLSALLRLPVGVLLPALGPSAQKRHGPIGVTPKEGHEDDHRAGAPILQGKIEEVSRKALLPLCNA